MQPQIMMLPPPCLRVGCTPHAVHGSSACLQFHALPPPLRRLILVSSLHNTFYQCYESSVHEPGSCQSLLTVSFSQHWLFSLDVGCISMATEYPSHCTHEHLWQIAAAKILMDLSGGFALARLNHVHNPPFISLGTPLSASMTGALCRVRGVLVATNNIADS